MPPLKLLCLLFAAVVLKAEIHDLTLQQALDLAARQNPDVALARLDQQRAMQGIKVARDPFVPKVYGGSGLAYTSGYPNSIEGNAPSIFQVRTDMAIFNRPKSYEVAAAKETMRGTQISGQNKSEEVAFRVANLFLDAQQARHQRDALVQQLPSLQKASETMSSRANEGSELPIEVKRAKVNLLAAQQRMEGTSADLDYTEALLATTLGFPASDRVHVVEGSAIAPPIKQSENDLVDEALRNNRDLRVMQSSMLAKQLQIRGYKSSRLPQVNLVAQYAIFARYNFENYFQRFQRSNAQLGASITVPLLIGSASNGMADQAATDMAKLRLQMNQLRNSVMVETHKSYDDWKKAEASRDLARQQLDLSREDLSIVLAQYGEGQLPISRVEQTRAVENEKWLFLYAAEAQAERARLAVFRQTGNLQTILRAFSDAPADLP